MYRLQSLKDDFRDTETRLGWQTDVVKLDLKADNTAWKPGYEST